MAAAAGGRRRGAVQPQPGEHPARARGARADRHLSVHEADHLLAATLPRPQFQLGRADRLDRGHRGARLAGVAALSRRHLLDDRLRHDLRPSGQGGRCRASASNPRPWRSERAPVRWLFVFYAAAVLLWGIGRPSRPGSARRSGSGWHWPRVQLAWQAARVDTDDPADCLAKFRSNRAVGWLLLAGIVAGRLI